MVSRLAGSSGICHHRTRLPGAGRSGSGERCIMDDALFTTFGLVIVIAPTLLVAILGITSIVGSPLSERAIGRTTHAAIVIGLLSALICLGLMLMNGEVQHTVELGHWVD